MILEIKQHDSTLIVTVSGRVDGATSAEFHNSLKSAITGEDRAVLLDCADLSYISSGGLRVLLIVAKALRKQNALLSVCSLSDSLIEIFEISGFNKIVPVYENVAAALPSPASETPLLSSRNQTSAGIAPERGAL